MIATFDRNRTERVIRELTRLRPAGHRPKPLPRPLGTDAIELEYFNALASLGEHAANLFIPASRVILADITAQSKSEAEARNDARSGKGAALKLVKEAAAQFSQSFPSREVHAIATKFGQRTTNHQRQQFDRQIRAAVGVPYAAIETPIRQQVPVWVNSNVALIKTVGPRYFARIEHDVRQAYETGMHPATLAEAWVSRRGMTQTDVMRIARDQIGKLNGALNQARQESLGVERYIWRCVRDNRVRECHLDLDGEVCDWDDPPEGGGTDEDEDGHPGSGILCRCYPEPDLSDLIK